MMKRIQTRCAFSRWLPVQRFLLLSDWGWRKAGLKRLSLF